VSGSIQLDLTPSGVVIDDSLGTNGGETSAGRASRYFDQTQVPTFVGTKDNR